MYGGCNYGQQKASGGDKISNLQSQPNWNSFSDTFLQTMRYLANYFSHKLILIAQLKASILIVCS